MKSEFYYQRGRFGECRFNFFCEFKELKWTRGSEDLRTSKSTLGSVGVKMGTPGYSYFSSTCIFGAQFVCAIHCQCVALPPAVALVCTPCAFVCQVSF